MADSQIFLMNDTSGLRLPYVEEVAVLPDAETFSFGGYVAVAPCYVEKWPDTASPFGLRGSWGRINEEDYAAAVKATALLNWNDSERFCARDAMPLKRVSEISKKCPLCGTEYFPRLNPAIVVLVTRGQEALLVHSNTMRGSIHALVAGFVETGETLEECVAREIKEETSLEVDSVRYIGSQPWPYPSQLMMGFSARYKKGEISFADGELTSGRFFTRESLPVLPTPPSLSRKIIDMWIEGKLP